MTVYNINLGIGWASSGVEYAQKYRDQSFDKVGIERKFIFSDLISLFSLSNWPFSLLNFEFISERSLIFCSSLLIWLWHDAISNLYLLISCNNSTCKFGSIGRRLETSNSPFWTLELVVFVCIELLRGDELIFDNDDVPFDAAWLLVQWHFCVISNQASGLGDWLSC